MRIRKSGSDPIRPESASENLDATRIRHGSQPDPTRIPIRKSGSDPDPDQGNPDLTRIRNREIQIRRSGSDPDPDQEIRI